MEDDVTFQYVKLLLEYIPVWFLMLTAFLLWIVKKPEVLKSIPKYVSSAKFGEFEIQLRQVEEKLSETEAHLKELEEDNLRLSQLYTQFDPYAPTEELEKTRQELKSLAGNLDNITPALEGLKAGSDPADIFAAAEILRQKRDFSTFDSLIKAVDRIASDNKLEGLRYNTVWTLASAVHRTVLAAVKHSKLPKLSKLQLIEAKETMQKLRDNPHVQLDRPDALHQGITGPAIYALNWIDKGLKKYEIKE